MRLRVLGPIELTGGLNPAVILSHPRDLALLTYLATKCTGGVFCSRDQVLAVFWPESDANRARNALKQALHRLRRATSHNLFVRRGARDIGLDPHQITSDIARFHQLLATGNRAAALDEYRGVLLEGFHIPNASGFEHWLDGARARIASAAAELSRDLREAAANDGDVRSALGWARRTVEISDRDEADVRRLIELLARSGNHAGAQRVYEDFERWLASELELTPSTETEALVSSLIVQRSVQSSSSETGSFTRPPGNGPSPLQQGAGSAIAAFESEPVHLVVPAAPLGRTSARQRFRERMRRAAPLVAAAVAVAASGALFAVRNAERSAGPEVPADAMAFYERGREYLEAGRARDREQNWTLAAEMFERAVNVSPGFASAHAALGTAHLRLFHWGYDRTTERQLRSKTAIDRSLALAPDNPEATMALGWYYEWGARDYERALAAGRRQLERRPNDPDAVTLVFSASRRLGRASEALPYMERAVQLSGQAVSLRRELASTHIGLRDYASAMAVLDESLALFPTDVVLHRWKWQATLLSSSDIAAAGALIKAARDRVDTRTLWPIEFDQHWLSRNYTEALAVLEREKPQYFHLQTGDFPIELMFGMVHRLAGREAMARRFYRRAIPTLRSMLQVRPDDAWFHGWLSVALAGAGERDTALIEAKLASELAELVPDPWANPYLMQEVLVHAYILAGERERAVKIVEQLVRSHHYASISRAWIEMDPRFDTLRSDPRFRLLMPAESGRQEAFIARGLQE